MPQAAARTRPAWLLAVSTAIAAWCCLIYAAAVIPKSVGEFQIPSLCGPWGCTSETNDLVAYHLVWLAVSVPAAVWFAVTYRPKRLRLAGRILFVTVGTLAAATLIFAGALWQAQHPDVPINGAWRYGLFLLFSNPDIPVLPTAVIGLIFAKFGPKTPNIDQLEDPAQDLPSDDHQVALTEPADTNEALV